MYSPYSNLTGEASVKYKEMGESMEMLIQNGDANTESDEEEIFNVRRDR